MHVHISADFLGSAGRTRKQYMVFYVKSRERWENLFGLVACRENTIILPFRRFLSVYRPYHDSVFASPILTGRQHALEIIVFLYENPMANNVVKKN